MKTYMNTNDPQTAPTDMETPAYRLWEAYQNGQLDFDAKRASLGVKPAETIHGQAELDITFDPEVYQFYNDTCAIQSQHLVLKHYGIDVTQNEMIEVAKANGWYIAGHGTPFEYVGKLLEHYGVDVEVTDGNNIFNLANELAQGHQVIVGVDSGELVHPEEEAWEDATYGEEADHALVVVGLDTTDPDNVKVIVTDPGTGNRQWAYSQEQFMDAWKDSNCFMVSTEQSPEQFQGLEYHPMESFGGIPTSTLEQMAGIDLSESYDFMDAVLDSIRTNPEGWANVVEEYPNIFYHDEEGNFHFKDPATGEELVFTEDVTDNYVNDLTSLDYEDANGGTDIDLFDDLPDDLA